MTEHLVSQFDAIDLTAITRMVEDKRQEDLHLDFKELTRSPEITKDDRKNFAIALSGFANSDGGMIVWGVEARKDNEGFDAAHALKLITNVKAVCSEFQSLSGKAVAPIVDGVVHKVFERPDGAGAIVSYVPASDSTPHRAEMGEGRYYKRSGDSFYRLEHFDLEDMFGRRAKPKLALEVELIKRGSVGEDKLVRPRLQVRNSGRGLARFPWIEFHILSKHRISPNSLDDSGRNPLKTDRTSRNGGKWYTYRGGSDDVVHINCALPITNLDTVLIQIIGLQAESIDIEYCIAAEGLRLEYGKLHLDIAKIRDFAKS